MKNPVIVLYRLGHFFQEIRLIWLATSITWLNRFLFATYVPSSATIGRNFKVGYWGLGVVIHSRTVIGDNCVVGQNVTIGRNFADKEVPIIGNDVYIGAGSAVFGEITIGDNVIIGANTVVNKSIPSNTTVVGNPMRVIETNRMKKYYEIDGPKFLQSHS